jgi:hypothetical protein
MDKHLEAQKELYKQITHTVTNPTKSKQNMCLQSRLLSTGPWMKTHDDNRHRSHFHW